MRFYKNLVTVSREVWETAHTHTYTTNTHVRAMKIHTQKKTTTHTHTQVSVLSTGFCSIRMLETHTDKLEELTNRRRGGGEKERDRKSCDSDKEQRETADAVQTCYSLPTHTSPFPLGESPSKADAV